jgi:hypothetical protein
MEMGLNPENIKEWADFNEYFFAIKSNYASFSFQKTKNFPRLI